MWCKMIWEMCWPQRSSNNVRAATWWAWLGRCWPSACTATAWAPFRTHRVQWPQRAATVTTGRCVLSVLEKCCRSDDTSAIPSLSQPWKRFAERISVMWCHLRRPTPGVSLCCCCSTTSGPSSSMDSCPCQLSKPWKQHETHSCEFSGQQTSWHWHYVL